MNARLFFKNGLKYVFAALALMLTLDGALAQVPFSKGVNLTSWFQALGPRQIQFTRFTRKDFERIKSLGCDAIRLPINLHTMTSGAPDEVFNFLETRKRNGSDFFDYALPANGGEHHSDRRSSERSGHLKAALFR
ncbi:hypothetical protein [Chryseolinea lacunae]|uniref:Glycoside hydrolase family 5 domain-containing protein n=1 Tax=Chryseolinea lacunae TaxID=2801331 RepID=A0ABS1KR69_9BACT|nr:hypothetical protein [Chryseolinea lacunae]MBL0741978.1 hypothetical protein [Chryseolinea lacunae]